MKGSGKDQRRGIPENNGNSGNRGLNVWDRQRANWTGLVRLRSITNPLSKFEFQIGSSKVGSISMPLVKSGCIFGLPQNNRIKVGYKLILVWLPFSAYIPSASGILSTYFLGTVTHFPEVVYVHSHPTTTGTVC